MLELSVWGRLMKSIVLLSWELWFDGMVSMTSESDLWEFYSQSRDNSSGCLEEWIFLDKYRSLSSSFLVSLLIKLKLGTTTPKVLNSRPPCVMCFFTVFVWIPPRLKGMLWLALETGTKGLDWDFGFFSLGS